jgi:hypothetical protein
MRLADLAWQAGVNVPWLSELENGLYRNPPVWRVAAIARALGVTTDALLGYPAIPAAAEGMVASGGLHDWVLMGMTLSEPVRKGVLESYRHLSQSPAVRGEQRV